MKLKHATMLVLLVPAMAMVSACNRDNTADDVTTPPADTAPAPADTTAVPPTDATTPAPADTTTPAPATGTMGDTGTELTFEQMDKNGDGGISPDELATTDSLYQEFAAADADGNGQLSADEIVKHRADMAAPAAPPVQ